MIKNLRFLYLVFITLWTLSCGQIFHITENMSTSIPTPIETKIEASDDVLANTGAGATSQIDVSINDSLKNCNAINYSVLSQKNVTVTNTGPNFNVTPTAAGDPH